MNECRTPQNTATEQRRSEHPAQPFLDRIRANLDAGLRAPDAVKLALAGRVRVKAR
jgi:hypothetical protein